MKKNYYLKNYYFFYLLLCNNIESIEKIKVLIKKIPITNSIIQLEFNNVKKINDYYDNDYYHHLNDKCIISYNQNTESWFLNNRKLKIKNIEIISSKENNLYFNNNEYPGSIIIQHDNNFIYIINNIDRETYVQSVVAKEFYIEWGTDALEIAAIIIRTYALYKIEEAKKNNRLFDIKSTIEDQTYEGLKKCPKINEAVNKTNGQIISYQGKPILSMYHICCGGVKPIECLGFDFKKCPYLKRSQECTGCKDYKYYFWKNNMQRNDLCEKLSILIHKKVTQIERIKKIIYSKSGAIRKLSIEIQIENHKKKKEKIIIILTNKQLRKLFNIQMHYYSSCFTINFNKNFDIEINGRGHGHHIGLCQRGMYGYIKQGFSIEKIIEFYFPNTIIINIL